MVRTGSLRTQSARHRVDHGTICRRNCANSGHYKPLRACVHRIFVNSNSSRRRPKKFGGRAGRGELSGYSEPAESLGFTRTISILGKLAGSGRGGCDASVAGSGMAAIGALFGVVFCNSFGAFVLSRDVGSSADAKPAPTSRAAAINTACCLMIIHLCRLPERNVSGLVQFP